MADSEEQILKATIAGKLLCTMENFLTENTTE